jgi:hypothetical protein
MVELCLYFSIRLHGMVRRDNFTFYLTPHIDLNVLSRVRVTIEGFGMVIGFI